MEQSAKNENESKCVLELYQYCERGMYTNIKKILEDNDFSSKTLDSAIRKTMKNCKRERHEFYDSLNLLLQYINVNFRNPNEDNSSVLMLACKLCDMSLIETLLDFDYTQNQANPKGIDLVAKDDRGRGFLHYLVDKDNPEEEVIEVFNKIIQRVDDKTLFRNYFSVQNGHNSSKSIMPEIGSEDSTGNETYESYANVSARDFLNALNIEDDEGMTPLSCTLKKGWTSLSKYFFQCRAKTSCLTKTENNNLIHLAVIGGNLSCIRLAMCNTPFEYLKQKNKSNHTPKSLALSKNLNYYVKIIENFEENCLNPNFSTFFSQRSHDLQLMLSKFYLEDYYETLFLLNQLKIDRSILSSATDYNIEWNIFLTKYYTKLSELNKDSSQKFEISPESILSKFLDKEPDKKNVLDDFRDFFDKINYENFDENKSPDILIYNKGLFYFKLGDIVKTCRIFSEYLKTEFPKNDTAHFKWFLYVNISFILIEGLCEVKHTIVVKRIIQKIEEFLFTHIRLKKDDLFTEDLIIVRDYLNVKEIINQHSTTWDESFCFINLLKAMKSIAENRPDEAKSFMRDFKKLYTICNYKEEVPVINSMYYVYTCLKIKILYLENSFTKCFKFLNKINKACQSNLNLKINEFSVERSMTCESEFQIFYFNAMGIINLKQRRFVAAELFFKAGINNFKKIYTKKIFDFSVRISYFFYLQYNLALALFFQKKWEKALGIFRELTKQKVLSMNPFLHYRVGLCIIEIHIQEMTKCRQSTSDLISSLQGYDTPLPEVKKTFYKEDLMASSVDLDFMEEEEIPTPTSNPRVILHHTKSVNKKRLQEAIEKFKTVLLLTCDNISLNSKLNEKGELQDIYNFYFDKKSAYLDENHDDEEMKSPISKSKSIGTVVCSSYLNLIYCLSVSESWTEVLFYCDDWEHSAYYKKEKDVIYKFENFRIEALIRLRENEKALNLVQSSLLNLSNDCRASFFNKSNGMLYSEVSYKVVLNVNMCKIHFLNNNLQEADKCISNLMNLLGNTVTDMPPFVQNLFIYSSLTKGDTKEALSFIKYRRSNLFSAKSKLNR